MVSYNAKKPFSNAAGNGNIFSALPNTTNILSPAKPL
jgi:hypothetical protein